MYKNIYIEERYTDQPTVHIWDSQKGHIEFEYNKKMYVRSPDGDYTSLYGDPLAEVPASNIDYNTKQRLQERYGEGEAIFQSDLQLETQILSEVYRDAEEPSEDLETLFFDIEVSMEGELPKVSTANNPITSIAYTVRSTGESKVLIWDPENETENFEEEGVEVIPFEGEDQLLYSFVEEWRDVDPDIITGWNSDGFDIPYLYRRVSKVINNDFADRLSPIEEVEFRKNRGERGEGRFFIAGVSALDYYSLYKNFTFTELDSYSLDNVSKEELDRGKVEYMGKEVETEDGETVVIEDLDDLKEYDPEAFVKYNVEDVWLVRDLDDKFDFIELARKICHLGHVPYEDIYMSSRYIDGAFITRLNKRGIIAPNVHRIEDFELDGFHSVGSKEIKLKNEIHPDIPRKGTIGIRVSSATKKKVDYERIEGDKFILEEPIDFEVFEDYSIGLEFEGAYVKEPDPGLYEWIYDLDLTSMYPSIIMSLNISPETLVGKIYDWSAEGFIKGEKETYKVWIFDEEEFSEFTNSELEKFLEEGEFSVAANGAFYRNDKKGIIPEVLEEWFTLRQEYKSTRNEWREKEGEKAEEKAEYYDKLQHVHKILINCFTPSHEIVTKDGVKNIEDVEEGDFVYSVDPETGSVEYKPVSRTYRQENYNGNVVNFQNSFVDFSVTPNHDMVFGDDEIYKEKAGNCLNDSDERRMWSHGALRKDSSVHVSLKNFCDRLGVDYEYDVQKDVIKGSDGQSAWIKNTYMLPNFLKLCGRYVFGAQSEPDDNGSHPVVTENNEEVDAENILLREILKKDFGEDAQSKRIPGWIWKLDGVILKNLLETIFSDEENRDNYQYKTGLEEFAQDVVRLAYHCGHRAVVESPANENISHYEVSIYDEDKEIPPLLKDEDRELEEYDGSIVCVEVEDNHTVLAGKNGKFNWIGQSVYGIMGLPTFRFFNLYCAEATTLTGQALIKYTQRMGDHYYNKKIGKDVEFEDGSEMNMDLNETYLVMRDGMKMEVKGKELQEKDELVIDE